MTVHAKALHRAAEILGGQDSLRVLLGVSVSELQAWMAGFERPPMDVFLKAVDIISAAPPSTLPPASDAVQRSRQLRRESEVLRLATERTWLRALQVRSAILAGGRSSAARLKPRSALAFLNAKFEPEEGQMMVVAALDATLTATGADMGNVQLVCPDGLRIVAQRGFEQPFLEFCAQARDDYTRALGQRRRVVVADVANDPLFAGTPLAEVMAKAHVRALQGTPLLAANGKPLGVLATHYEEPHQPEERELDVIDHIAGRTAFWLAGGSL